MAAVQDVDPKSQKLSNLSENRTLENVDLIAGGYVVFFKKRFGVELKELKEILEHDTDSVGKELAPTRLNPDQAMVCNINWLLVC